MLNREPPPLPMINPPATPLNRETTSLRKKRRARSIPIPPFVEVVDLDSSFLTPIAKSLKGASNSKAVAAQNGGVSTPVHIIDLSDTEDDDEVRILKYTPTNTSIVKRNKAKREGKGECSNAAPFVCEICTETKTTRDSFYITGCCHVYCKDCVALYVESKVEENVVNIGCPVPRCRGLLEAEDCREILAPRVFDGWGKALCEAVIAEEDKFYCPFDDCSALLIRGSDGDDEIRECECPNCRRLFCVQCRVPWHGIPCEEFQKLNADERQKEDIMLINLAEKMMWKRCPTCSFYVAKSDGCLYIKCRCGTAFCYNCGSPNLTTLHNCSYCGR